MSRRQLPLWAEAERAPAPPSSRLLAVNYGAGTNSTALLVGMHERGVRPDAICFADTGGERPETYSFLATIDEWLRSVGFPALTVVRWIRVKGQRAGEFVSLEEACLERRELPSLAYGFSGCSVKWKAQPVERWLRRDWPEGQAALERGEPIRRALGIDADEPHRAKDSRHPDLWSCEYPLIEWDWGRDECKAAIERARLPQPGKSSCFYCPSMKPREIIQLGRRHPDLLARALKIEANAPPREGAVIKGLGRRNFSWREVWGASEAGDATISALPASTIDEPCSCYDGDTDDGQQSLL